MGGQSDHESGFFEGDEGADDDEVEIIHEEINNPGTMIKTTKGKILHTKMSSRHNVFSFKFG